LHEFQNEELLDELITKHMYFIQETIMQNSMNSFVINMRRVYFLQNEKIRKQAKQFTAIVLIWNSLLFSNDNHTNNTTYQGICFNELTASITDVLLHRKTISQFFE
jgi:hypothetical protein